MSKNNNNNNNKSHMCNVKIYLHKKKSEFQNIRKCKYI